MLYPKRLLLNDKFSELNLWFYTLLHPWINTTPRISQGHEKILDLYNKIRNLLTDLCITLIRTCQNEIFYTESIKSVTSMLWHVIRSVFDIFTLLFYFIYLYLKNIYFYFIRVYYYCIFLYLYPISVHFYCIFSIYILYFIICIL